MEKTELVLKGLCESLESVKPSIWADRGFTTPRGGIAEPLESWIRDADARQLREAVIRFVTLPSYGSSLCYYNLIAVVEVAYPASIPEDVREAMVTSDANEIVQQMTRRPAMWGGAESVYPTQSAALDSIMDDNGQDVLFVLTVSFNVIMSVFEPPED